MLLPLHLLDVLAQNDLPATRRRNHRGHHFQRRFWIRFQKSNPDWAEPKAQNERLQHLQMLSEVDSRDEKVPEECNHFRHVFVRSPRNDRHFVSVGKPNGSGDLSAACRRTDLSRYSRRLRRALRPTWTTASADCEECFARFRRHLRFGQSVSQGFFFFTGSMHKTDKDAAQENLLPQGPTAAGH